jgi:hypothetical protein
MMFKVVTIAREFGAGGAETGRKVADLLGWQYLDKEIIEQAAAAGQVARNLAEAADERSRRWWDKVLLGFQQTGQGMIPPSVIDYDTVKNSTVAVIKQAAMVGNCVIIGRSSQCVLHKHPQVLHALVYAPLLEKIARMDGRDHGEHDTYALLRRIDAERTHYTQTYYGKDWSDRSLYHLCVNSTLGTDLCAKMIVQTVHPC